MKYLIYEYGKPGMAKECKTLHEALRELHKGKENKEYRIRMVDEKYIPVETISVRYKELFGLIITEIL